MQKVLSLNEYILDAQKQDLSFAQYAIKIQAAEMEISEQELLTRMFSCINVMKEGIKKGLSVEKTRGGLAGGDAKKINAARENGSYKDITGRILSDAIQYSIATGELNASMGKIVAAPTAGASGVIPGVFFALQNHLGFTDEELAKGLVSAGLIGMVIASRASLAGAIGGCQAECGSAAAMAAGAAVDMAGGSPEQVENAAAIALKNMLGLVCDPVAGLVEVPCIKRNAGAATQALVAAQMALAGIKSFIPADEVFDAMRSVGNVMPSTLKETAEGGLAASPTACQWTSKFLGNN